MLFLSRVMTSESGTSYSVVAEEILWMFCTKGVLNLRPGSDSIFTILPNWRTATCWFGWTVYTHPEIIIRTTMTTIPSNTFAIFFFILNFPPLPHFL